MTSTLEETSAAASPSGGFDEALAVLEATAQMAWIGSSVGFAFVSAPVAFHVVPDVDTFATLTERTLARLGTLSSRAGGVAIASALVRAARGTGSRAPVARAVATALALGCVAVQQRAIVPAMTAAQRAMGSIGEVAADDPRRVTYRRWHKRSTQVYGTALLLGTAALAASVMRRSSAPATPAAVATRLDHLTLTVTDVARSQAWFARVLNMEPTVSEDGAPALRFGEARLDFAAAETASGARVPMPGSADLCFFTTSEPLVDVLAELGRAGVPIEVGPIAREGARRPLSSVYVRDPDGNLVEIANER